MPTAPKFAAYVRSVEGRTVSRWGTRELLGAERVRDEGGKVSIRWFPDRVIPLTDVFVARYRRELDRALRGGDLVKATAEEYTASAKAEADREAKRDAEIEKQRQADKKAADKAAKKTADEQPAAPAASEEPAG